MPDNFKDVAYSLRATADRIFQLAESIENKKPEKNLVSLTYDLNMLDEEIRSALKSARYLRDCVMIATYPYVISAHDFGYSGRHSVGCVTYVANGGGGGGGSYTGGNGQAIGLSGAGGGGGTYSPQTTVTVTTMPKHHTLSAEELSTASAKAPEGSEATLPPDAPGTRYLRPGWKVEVIDLTEVAQAAAPLAMDMAAEAVEETSYGLTDWALNAYK